jgi:hypothetical protein
MSAPGIGWVLAFTIAARDLAHAHPKPTLRSERRRFSSGGLIALFGLAPASERSNFA